MSVRHVVVKTKLVMVDEFNKPLSTPTEMTEVYVCPENSSIDEMKKYLAQSNEHLRDDGLVVVEQTFKYEEE